MRARRGAKTFAFGGAPERPSTPSALAIAELSAERLAPVWRGRRGAGGLHGHHERRIARPRAQKRPVAGAVCHPGKVAQGLLALGNARALLGASAAASKAVGAQKLHVQENSLESMRIQAISLPASRLLIMGTPSPMRRAPGHARHHNSDKSHAMSSFY